MGKNLSLLPVAALIGLIYLIILIIALQLSFIVILAVVFQLLAGFVLLSILGNLISILVPFRMAPGTLKRTKTSTMTAVMIFISRLLFPIAMVPISIPPAIGLLISHLGWLSAGPVNLFFSIVLLAVLIFCYKLSLPVLGELLLSREKNILKVVTKEVE